MWLQVFRIPENANEFVRANYSGKAILEARIIDQVSFFYVYYDGFTNRAAASALLDSPTEKIKAAGSGIIDPGRFQAPFLFILCHSSPPIIVIVYEFV